MSLPTHHRYSAPPMPKSANPSGGSTAFNKLSTVLPASTMVDLLAAFRRYIVARFREILRHPKAVKPKPRSSLEPLGKLAVSRHSHGLSESVRKQEQTHQYHALI